MCLSMCALHEWKSDSTQNHVKDYSKKKNVQKSDFLLIWRPFFTFFFLHFFSTHSAHISVWFHIETKHKNLLCAFLFAHFSFLLLLFLFFVRSIRRLFFKKITFWICICTRCVWRQRVLQKKFCHWEWHWMTVNKVWRKWRANVFEKNRRRKTHTKLSTTNKEWRETKREIKEETSKYIGHGNGMTSVHSTRIKIKNRKDFLFDDRRARVHFDDDFFAAKICIDASATTMSSSTTTSFSFRYMYDVLCLAQGRERKRKIIICENLLFNPCVCNYALALG